jgi:hypothetical protein
MAQHPETYSSAAGRTNSDHDLIEVAGGSLKLKQISLMNGLLRYYKFDQASWGVSAADVTNYALVGPDASSFNCKPTKYGKIGRGAYQALDNDVFSEPSPADFPTGNAPRTITMWMKPDQVAVTQYTWAWGQTGVDREFYGAIGAGGSIWVGRGSGNIVITSTGVITANEWNLVVIEFDSTTFTVYVNNVNEGSAARPTLNTGTGNPFYIGRRFTTPAGGFHGSLGDFMIHDRVLTSDERDYLWNSGNGKQFKQYSGTNNVGTLTDIAVVYNMEGNVLDSSPMVNDGTNTDVTFAAGKVGNAGVFNGTSSSILVPSLWDNVANPTFDTSVAFWARRDSNTGTEYIIEYDSDNKYFRIEFDDLSQMQVHWTDGVGAQVMTHAIDPSSYHFYEVRIVDGGTCEILVDNVSVATQASTTVQALLNDGIRVGSNRNNTDRWLEGQIDQFVVKQGQFTTEERTTMYSAGAGGTLPGFTNTVNPSSFLTAGYDDPETNNFTSFNRVASGSGSAGYQLSSDGVNFQAFIGGSWQVTTDVVNSASEVSDNISSFPVTKIYVKVFLISEGDNQFEVDEFNIVYNTDPVVFAGANKPISGTLKNNVSFNPYIDCTINDAEGTAGGVLEHRINGSAPINIPQGIFPTFQEAARSLSQFAGDLNIGVNTMELIFTDSEGATHSDIINVTVIEASVVVGEFTPDALDQFLPQIESIQASIDALNDFNHITDTVARVTLVDTTTNNTDMRGTDGANTVVPDNAGISAIESQTDRLNFTGDDVKATLDGEEVTTDIASRNASKADVSALATSVALEEVKDLSTDSKDALLGDLEVASNQLQLKRTGGGVLATYDLFDEGGQPTNSNAFKRTKV